MLGVLSDLLRSSSVFRGNIVYHLLFICVFPNQNQPKPRLLKQAYQTSGTTYSANSVICSVTSTCQQHDILTANANGICQAWSILRQHYSLTANADEICQARTTYYHYIHTKYLVQPNLAELRQSNEKMLLITVICPAEPADDSEHPPLLPRLPNNDISN